MSVESHRAANTRHRTKLRALVDAAKDQPCADCGGLFPPYVMDLDHLPGSGKVASVARIAESGSRERLLAEIAKCEAVCSNCHRVRTYGGARCA